MSIFSEYGHPEPSAWNRLPALKELRAKRVTSYEDITRQAARSALSESEQERERTLSRDIERIDEELEPLKAQENRRMKKASQIMAARTDPEEDFATNNMFHIRGSVPQKRD